MSSAVDDDTAQALASGRDAIGGILSTAQTELQKVFIIFVVGFLGTFAALRVFIWDWLEAVTISGMDEATREQVDIIVTTPFEVILLQAKIGILAGILIALPLLIFLSRRELKDRGRWPSLRISRGRLVGVGILSVLLFVGGIAYAYELFFPFMFEFLASQAINVGVVPTYGIVQWTEFLILLTLSFGFAAQLPLVMTGTSYAGLVSYEGYRDKWKHAVVIIFVFGAFFSPPDPFTLLMWAVPLIGLYVFSLALSKLATNVRRAGGTDAALDGTSRLRRRAAGLIAVGVLSGIVTAVAVEAGLLDVLYTEVRPLLPEVVRPTEPLGIGAHAATFGELGPVILGLYVGALVVAVPAVIVALIVLRRPVYPPRQPDDPERVDLNPLPAERIRELPEHVFEAMTEEEATEYASNALEENDQEKAELVFERFDRAQPEEEEDGGAEGGEPDEESGSIGDTATGVVSAFSEDRDEEDIGGLIDDFRLIADSLRSRMFRIFAVFGIVIAAVFTFLYQDGLQLIYDDFTSRLPDAVAEEADLIALHPVEVLIFIVKFSTLAAVLAVVPMVLYYAWPSMTELGWVRARRDVVYKWTVGMLLTLAAGTALGYFVIAPGIISYLVYDAISHGMVITYRISAFAWLIIFTTVGIGLFSLVPFTMWMLYLSGMASYDAMRNRWREVTIAAFVFAGVFTPAGVLTMFLVGIPMMIFYWVGLVVLWLATLGGRRGRYAHGEVT